MVDDLETHKKTSNNIYILSSTTDDSIDDLIDSYIAEIVHAIILKRKHMNYTQKDVSELTGLKQSSISRIESLRVVPTLPMLIRIMDAINLKIEICSSSTK
jgi:DNA-binding XRE family transcriptional regulator